jgi:hypothetical protein
MAVMKSQAGSDYGWEKQGIRKRKKTRIRKTYFEQRFFALTVWGPSIGSADAHVHDKVEFYTDPDRKASNAIY